MHIQPIQLLLAILVIIVLGAGIFVVSQNDNKENIEISQSSANIVILNNGGGNMEGHTPRGFQGMGAGLFVGDNLNSRFPEGDGVQIFLTFDIGVVPVDAVVSATLYSDSAHIQGTPFEDLGSLKAETVRYNAFSSKLWNLKSSGQACIFGVSSEELFECDVTDEMKRALDSGDTSLQFRISFEKAGDNDGEQDLVMFYNTDSNTNEPGIFQLVIITSNVSTNADGGEQQSIPARSNILDDIHVPVILYLVKESGFISTERNSDNIHALFQKTQAIWDQARIVFDVEFQEITLDDALQKAMAREEFERLFAALPANDSLVNDAAFHIFFIRTLNGPNGIALAPSLALIADRTTVNDFRATAHEIGHLLGLRHTSPDRGRLLFRGVNGTELIFDEITQSRLMATFLEHNPGKM